MKNLMFLGGIIYILAKKNHLVFCKIWKLEMEYILSIANEAYLKNF